MSSILKLKSSFPQLTELPPNISIRLDKTLNFSSKEKDDVAIIIVCPLMTDNIMTYTNRSTVTSINNFNKTQLVTPDPDVHTNP
jgi:hypothetical protein